MIRRRQPRHGIWFDRTSERWQLLSNFALTPFALNGQTWPTVEHYSQANKALSASDQDQIAQARSPFRARQLGRRIKLRPEWDAIRGSVMLAALRAKFTRHDESREVLLSTGTQEIHEDASGDTYWGAQGEDRLGQLLMMVRDEVVRA